MTWKYKGATVYDITLRITWTPWTKVAKWHARAAQWGYP